ncbi:MAG: ATP/GTP-binding protein [Rhodospirillaceae bacterium]|nr:ATP/GTP-binding protein [Rhodospirillaceae bacterium]
MTVLAKSKALDAALPYAGHTTGGRAAVAAALNLLDDRRPRARTEARALLDALAAEVPADKGHVVGVTGPPGVGKSTLTGAIIRHWRSEGRSVGILAVDPSSPIGGGALLGDRLRMLAAAEDDGVFIRSLADRRAVGGLSDEVWPMCQVLIAAFDVVIVETVGVGQRDVDVTHLADTTCLVAQPFAGDMVQFLKAGILEVPQVIAVNKTDLGQDWEGTVAEISAVSATDHGGWTTKVVPTSARNGIGIGGLAAALDAHHTWLSSDGRLAARRRDASADWVLRMLAAEFGRYGISTLGGEAALRARLADSPGSALAQIEALTIQLTGTQT